VPAPRAALSALGLTLVLWASAFVAIRHLGESFSPVAISVIRQTVAALALGSVVAIRGFTWPGRRDWPALITIGVLWFAIYHVALNEAERRVDAGTASMLLQVSPILLTILAAIFLKEPTSQALFVGLLIAFVGVSLIAYATSETGGGDVIGVLLCLVSAAAYSFSVILQKPMLVRVNALNLTFIASVIGAVVVLPFAAAVPGEIADGSVADLGWLVYLGLFPTALAFTTWAFALSHLPANLMGVSTYLVPPITVAIAWVLLGETPPGLAYLGGALCLIGVWLARRPRRPAPADPSRIAA
jgi:drug/metabolite transporter (DMT)-like permease